MATLRKLKKMEDDSQKSTSYDTYLYVEWAQKICRNIQEYNFLLSIKDLYDRTLIVTNANLFFEIQNLLKIKTPYISEFSFDEILNYVYEYRIYYDMWYEGYYFHSSALEKLPNDSELKSFIRLHFDPNSKKLNGSSMDKVIAWIKDGWALDQIVQTLKHYYDHKKMYQDSHVFIENLNCEDFLKLSQSSNFKIFKYSYIIFSKLNESLRIEISNDPDLYKNFLKLVHEYIQYHNNRFNHVLFESALLKIDQYKNRTSELLIYLTNSIQGFDFDGEVATIRKAVVHNNNLKIIADETDFFIYKINNYETLKIYSAPQWCINRNIDQFEKYISAQDDFYILLQRNPRSLYNYKSGVTISKNRKKNSIKHSFNYADISNVEVARNYMNYFQKKNVLEKFKILLTFWKKKKEEDNGDDGEYDIPPPEFDNDEEVANIPPNMNEPMNEEVEEGSNSTILPRF